MNKLDEFLDIVCGEFDNSEQFNSMKTNGIDFVYAKHINTKCNDHINNLPSGFTGQFVVLESYYTTDGKTNKNPHLFCFSLVSDRVKLDSFELPEGYSKDSFTYKNLGRLDYNLLVKSSKFTPAYFSCIGGVWTGGSTSMFTPVTKFILHEEFSKDHLVVSESMEVNGKRVFGFDEPIVYRKI